LTSPGTVSLMLMLFYGLPPRVLNCTPAFDTASASLNNIPTKRRNVARCRIAPLATLGRPESSRLLKVNHSMLHLAMKMRSGGWAATSQHDDADTGGGVVRSFDPGSVTRGTACLTQMCIQGDLKAVRHIQPRRVLETTFFAYRGV
jgi:hypothetical protein